MLTWAATAAADAGGDVVTITGLAHPSFGESYELLIEQAHERPDLAGLAPGAWGYVVLMDLHSQQSACAVPLLRLVEDSELSASFKRKKQQLQLRLPTGVVAKPEAVTARSDGIDTAASSSVGTTKASDPQGNQRDAPMTSAAGKESTSAPAADAPDAQRAQRAPQRDPPDARGDVDDVDTTAATVSGVEYEDELEEFEGSETFEEACGQSLPDLEGRRESSGADAASDFQDAADGLADVLLEMPTPVPASHGPGSDAPDQVRQPADDESASESRVGGGAPPADANAEEREATADGSPAPAELERPRLGGEDVVREGGGDAAAESPPVAAAGAPVDVKKRRKKKKSKAKKASAGGPQEPPQPDAEDAEAHSAVVDVEPTPEAAAVAAAEGPVDEAGQLEGLEEIAPQSLAALSTSAEGAELAPKTPESAAVATRTQCSNGAALERHCSVTMAQTAAPALCSADFAERYNPLTGPFLRIAEAKQMRKGKGEDRSVVATECSIAHESDDTARAHFTVLGLFDGHGGQQAASYAAKHVLDVLKDELEIAVAPTLPEPDALVPEMEELTAVWALQEILLEALPAALTATFHRLDGEIKGRTKAGTTATVAVLVGWQLVVATVGDSCLHLDVGKEVLRVNATHRLDDNQAEQDRLRAAGVSLFKRQYTDDPSMPDGPLRVEPDGLMLSRTLGDADSLEHILSTPEIDQVTIPAVGGRVVLATDGLWDVIEPKNACFTTRSQVAGTAANKLLASALRKHGIKDDISIVMLDMLPDSDDKLARKTPPCLTKGVDTQAELFLPEPAAPIVVRGGTAADVKAALQDARAQRELALRRQARIQSLQRPAAAGVPAPLALSTGDGPGEHQPRAEHLSAALSQTSKLYVELSNLRVDTSELAALKEQREAGERQRIRQLEQAKAAAATALAIAPADAAPSKRAQRPAVDAPPAAEAPLNPVPAPAADVAQPAAREGPLVVSLSSKEIACAQAVVQALAGEARTKGDAAAQPHAAQSPVKNAVRTAPPGGTADRRDRKQRERPAGPKRDRRDDVGEGRGRPAQTAEASGAPRVAEGDVIRAHRQSERHDDRRGQKESPSQAGARGEQKPGARGEQGPGRQMGRPADGNIPGRADPQSGRAADRRGRPPPQAAERVDRPHGEWQEQRAGGDPAMRRDGPSSNRRSRRAAQIPADAPVVGTLPGDAGRAAHREERGRKASVPQLNGSPRTVPQAASKPDEQQRNGASTRPTDVGDGGGAPGAPRREKRARGGRGRRAADATALSAAQGTEPGDPPAPDAGAAERPEDRAPPTAAMQPVGGFEYVSADVTRRIDAELAGAPPASRAGPREDPPLVSAAPASAGVLPGSAAHPWSASFLSDATAHISWAEIDAATDKAVPPPDAPLGARSALSPRRHFKSTAQPAGGEAAPGSSLGAGAFSADMLFGGARPGGAPQMGEWLQPKRQQASGQHGQSEAFSHHPLAPPQSTLDSKYPAAFSHGSSQPHQFQPFYATQRSAAAPQPSDAYGNAPSYGIPRPTQDFGGMFAPSPSASYAPAAASDFGLTTNVDSVPGSYASYGGREPSHLPVAGDDGGARARPRHDSFGSGYEDRQGAGGRGGAGRRGFGPRDARRGTGRRG